MNNDLKYYLIVDNSMQWSAYAVICRENDKTKYPHFANDYSIEKYIDVNFNDKNNFFSNIYSREPHFINKTFNLVSRGGYVGWAISKKEFDTIRRICELRPAVEEYNRLVNS